MDIPQNVRVLIAEDDYLVRESLKGTIEVLGYTIVGEATDGEKVVELTQALRPDVILMDIAMPRLDGLGATEKIQARNPTPVVILTAYEDSALLARASAAGASAYLLKPPNAGAIERAVATAIARFADMMTIRQYAFDLKQRNEELDAYAQTVAHDLKNPLGSVAGYSQLLMDDLDQMSPSEIRESARAIVKGAGKMKDIVESLLILASVRQQEIAAVTLDMGPIVQEALNSLQRQIQECQAEVISPDAPAWPKATGYAPWVEAVWVNYISNALKYGAAEGQSPHIELGFSINPQASHRTFWVRDEGPGLSPEKRSLLFKPFVRFQKQYEGHGLGLTIVQRIVQKLGGQVGVESSLGQGSTFFFTLPAA